LVVAVFTIILGSVGLISPDSLTTVRRLYFSTPLGLYAAGAVRAKDFARAGSRDVHARTRGDALEP
jgi:hypothetical protein